MRIPVVDAGKLFASNAFGWAAISLMGLMPKHVLTSLHAEYYAHIVQQDAAPRGAECER
jgi:hypothetical protein